MEMVGETRAGDLGAEVACTGGESVGDATPTSGPSTPSERMGEVSSRSDLFEGLRTTPGVRLRDVTEAFLFRVELTACSRAAEALVGLLKAGEPDGRVGSGRGAERIAGELISEREAWRRTGD